jgi:predicted nucleic acid-binding protein
MSDRSFFDTNILVYSRDTSDATKHQVAQALVREAWQHRSGTLSAQVLSEYYVTVTQKLDPGLTRFEAWDDVSSLCSWRPIAIDEECLRVAHEAQQRFGISWWDSLIVAAAHRSGASRLYTEDLNHGQSYLGVEAVNPFLTPAQTRL